MTRMITLLTEGFADWETTLLNAAARSYYGIETRYATPDGAVVRSMGGLAVTPDLALADVTAAEFDVLVVCGGTAWQSDGAPDLGPVLADFRAQQRLIALICDGVFAAARTGLLDHLRHTSNDAASLAASGYAGAAHYVESPRPVTDDRVITAPGTAGIALAGAVLAGLGLGNEELEAYLGLHGRQFAT